MNSERLQCLFTPPHKKCKFYNNQFNRKNLNSSRLTYTVNRDYKQAEQMMAEM